MNGAEKALVAQSDKADGEFFAREGDLGAVGQGLPTGVHAEAELLGLGMGDESQLGRVGDYDGAEGEVMHPDGCDDQTAAVGGEDGASATKGVGRGASRGGHDDTVAGIGGHKVAGDIKVGAEQGLLDKTMETHFVECKGGEAAACGGGYDVEERTGLEGVAAGQEVGDEAVDVVAPGGGEETEVAEIDSQDRDVAVGNEVDGTEEGAIATDGEEKVELALGQLVLDNVGLHTPAVEEGDEALERMLVLMVDVADVKCYVHGDDDYMFSGWAVLPEEGYCAGIGFECAVGMAAGGPVGINALGQGAVVGVGAVPAVAEAVGDEHPLPPAGVDFEAEVLGQQGRGRDAKETHRGVARPEDVGYPDGGLDGGREEHNSGVGQEVALGTTVGDGKPIGIGFGTAADVVVGVVEKLLGVGGAGGMEGGDVLERQPLE